MFYKKDYRIYNPTILDGDMTQITKNNDYKFNFYLFFFLFNH